PEADSAVHPRGCEPPGVETQGQRLNAALVTGQRQTAAAEGPPQVAPLPAPQSGRALLQQLDGAGSVVAQPLALGRGDVQGVNVLDGPLQRQLGAAALVGL